jgi:hypothetical protein
MGILWRTDIFGEIEQVDQRRKHVLALLFALSVVEEPARSIHVVRVGVASVNRKMDLRRPTLRGDDLPFAMVGNCPEGFSPPYRDAKFVFDVCERSIRAGIRLQGDLAVKLGQIDRSAGGFALPQQRDMEGSTFCEEIAGKVLDAGLDQGWSSVDWRKRRNDWPTIENDIPQLQVA